MPSPATTQRPILLRLALLLASLAALTGCAANRTASLVARPLAADGAAPDVAGVALSGAGGEWLDLTFAARGDATAVRVLPLTGERGESIPLETRLYRVVDVPADLNHAAYLRLHGGDGRLASLPRVLVPLDRAGDGWTLPPGDGETRLWLDLRLPPGLARGRWRTAVRAVGPGGGTLAELPVTVQSHGFDLPDRPRLAVVGELPWDRLGALWPADFGDVSPRLLSRTDPASRAAVGRLDALVALARADRVTATVPDLAPIVKWPAGRPPEIFWDAYDALVRPWLAGLDFAGWPLPRMEKLAGYSDAARRDYWRAAFSHLDGTGVLDKGVARLGRNDVDADAPAARREAGLTPAEQLRLCAEAGRVAGAYNAGRIAVPVAGDEVRFTGPDNPGLFPPEQAGRLMIRGDGPVVDRPARPWPAGLPEPMRYLDLHAPTPAPVAGPGATEADLRLWGWLAFLRNATLLDLGDALPAGDPARPVDPTRLAWFYPGAAFGHDGPVPTVQLKWLRRLEQDYEYLMLAADHAEEPFARVVARTLVRPVRVEAGQSMSPLLPLIGGTPQDAAWRDGLALVADRIAAATPGLRGSLPPRFAVDLTNRTTAWLFPRERPAAVVTTTRWDLGRDDETGDARLFLRAGVSVYNPSDARPEGMTLGFAALPGGNDPLAANGPWRTPGTNPLPPVATYEVGQFTLGASAPVRDLAGGLLLSGQVPMRVSVRDEAAGGVFTAEAVAPVAVLDARAEPPTVDGLLGEWSGNEAIVDGPMVQMHSRPALQSGRIERGAQAAQAFVAWTDAGLHVAFKLPGVPTAAGVVRQSKNFVDTEFGRVWGEDACELLIQPVWSRPQGPAVEGPLLLVVCKPDGAFARRRGDRRRQVEPWQNFESGLRYAATVDAGGVWRAEVTLPWQALRTAGLDAGGVPDLLRFNLAHHDGQSGQSTSWAGPVDSGSDESFTGALVLRRDGKAGFSDQ